MSQGVREGADVRLEDVTVSIPVAVENPFVVRGAGGELLGSAVVTPGADRWYVRLILDPHHPETLDLALDPARCTMSLQVELQDGQLRGGVTLFSK